MPAGKYVNRRRLLALAVLAALPAPARALVIVPTFLSSVTSLPNAAQIESAFNYAAAEYQGLYTDPITINITVNTMTTGLGASNSNFGSNFITYSALRTALVNDVTTNDQQSNVAYNFPTNDPTGNNSQYRVSTAEQKALGLSGASSAVDGTFLFNSTSTYTFDPYDRAVGGATDFVGVAEHEISEIMGRTPDLGTLINGKSTYRPFDLTRYTAPNVRAFNVIGANVYFSPDGGTTNLKPDNSVVPGDADDWATVSPYVADSFNAFSSNGVQNSLTPADAIAMDVLGYNRGPTALSWTGGNADFLTAGHWSNGLTSGLNPFHSSVLTFNSPGNSASHFFKGGENYLLSETSDMGQGLIVSGGTFDVDAVGIAAANSYGLVVSQNAQVTVNSTGILNVAGEFSIGNDANSTSSSATINGSSTVNVGDVFGADNNFTIGGDGFGTCSQSGSSTVNTGVMYVGRDTPGSGIYFLGGTANLNVAHDELVGFDGTGVFSQSGGTNTVKGTLSVGSIFNGGLGENDRYDFDGGTINAASMIVVSTAGFNQSTGTLVVTNTLEVSSTDGSTSGNVSLSGGVMQAGAIQVHDSGVFTESGGSIVSTGGIEVGEPGSAGTYMMTNGGITGGSISVAPASSFTQNGGVIFPTLLSQGTFTYGGGTFFGRLINEGSVNFNADFAPDEGMENDVPLILASGRTLTFNGVLGSLDNESDLTINGVIAGTGVKTNYGTMTGIGSISGSGQFINVGTFNQLTNRVFTFSLAGAPYENSGTINLASTFLAHYLTINTPNSPSTDLLNNTGIINFIDPSTGVTGTGGLENNTNGTLVCNGGNINTAYFVNNVGGLMLIQPGKTNVLNSWANAGTVQLTDPSSILAGGSIAVNGMLSGQGTVSSSGVGAEPNGIIEATGGTLLLTGTVFNLHGTLQADTDGILQLASTGKGLPTNDGTLNLNGGTIDNNGNVMTNEGQITGYGTLNTGGLTNGFIFGTNIVLGSMTLGGGTSTINGDVTNVTTIDVQSGDVGFTGNLTNNTTGSISVEAAAEMDLSGPAFTNKGAFNSAGTLASSTPIQNNATGSLLISGQLIQSANITNNGTTVISGPQLWAAGTTFTNNGGSAQFQSDAGAPGASTLAIQVSAGIVTFTASQHLVSLSIDNSVAQVDLTDRRITIDFGGSDDPVADILASLTSGYAGGAWSGDGLVSSTAGASNNKFTIGYADGDNPADSRVAGLFADQLIIEYTLAGDANLDGSVGFEDLVEVAQNFGTTGNDWATGNFTYDPAGDVEFPDLVFVAQNFDESTGLDESAISPAWHLSTSPTALTGGLTTATPEPTSVGLMIGTAVVLLRRKRRS